MAVRAVHQEGPVVPAARGRLVLGSSMGVVLFWAVQNSSLGEEKSAMFSPPKSNVARQSKNNASALSVRDVLR
jgi:hypothetical protein